MFLFPSNYFTVFYSFIAFDSLYALLLKAATINLFTPLVCVSSLLCVIAQLFITSPHHPLFPAVAAWACLCCLEWGVTLCRVISPSDPTCRGASCHICSGDLPSSPPPATRVISRRWSPPPSPHLWRRLSESKPRITIRPHAPSLSVRDAVRFFL